MLTPEQLVEALKGLGVPVTYLYFPENEAPPPPFICWSFSGEEDTAADNINYVKIRTVRIDIYSAFKNLDLENETENLFNELEEPYEKLDSYDNNDKVFITTYYISMLI